MGIQSENEKKPICFDFLVSAVFDIPIVRDQPIYYSYLLVHKDHPAQTLDDLRGATFAFNGRDSFSGWGTVERHLIQNQFVKDNLANSNAIEGFFKDVTETGGHRQSLHRIANQQSDCCAIDIIVWEFLQKHASPEIQWQLQQVRIIQPTFGPAPNHPWIISNSIKESVRNKIKQAFINLSGDDKDDSIVLSDLCFKRFAPISFEAHYRSMYDWERIKRTWNN